MEKQHVKILAIDDSTDNLIDLRTLINEAFPDAVFLSASTGLLGLEICRKENPDVILLNIAMPGVDGIEVCIRLKSNESLKHIPVIILIKGSVDKMSRVHALQAGAQAFLHCPVDGSELKAQIQLLLRIRESEDVKSKEKQRLEDMVLDRTAALEIELADRKKAENKLILSLDKITRNRQAIMNLMEDLKVEMAERKHVEENIREKIKELQFLNKLATDLSSFDPAESIAVFLINRLKEFTGSEFLVYSEYDSDKKLFITRHIDADKVSLQKLIKVASDKILNNPAPINITPESFHEMLTEVVTEKNSLNELSFGAIPKVIDNAFSSFAGIDRYIGLSYVVSGKIYGTTLMGLKKNQTNPSSELLKSFAHIIAVSMHRRRAEATLKVSEEKFRLLIENQGEGVGIVDLDEKFVFANPAAEEMLGVEKGALLNHSLLDFVKPEHIPVIKRETRKRTKDKKTTYEVDIIRPNGEQRTLLITATPQFSKDRILTGTFGVFRDITDRKNAELEIVKKQEFIEKILENSPIGFAVNRIDDGSIIYVGSKFEEIYGVPRGSLKSVSEFFEVVYADPGQRAKMRERTIDDIISQDQSRMRWEDIEITTRSGDLRYITAINIPLYEQNLMISTVQDVTARNISEKALKESYEFNNSLLSTIPFGMDIVDENGTVLFQSVNFLKLFGDKAIGSKCWDLYREDKKQCLNCPLYSGIRIGMTGNYESEGVLGNRVFDISHTGILFQGKKAMLEIFIDITERKRMEQKIIESEAYYRTLIDISPDGIIVSNHEGIVSYASKKAYEIFGIPAGESVVGTSILKGLAPEYQEAIMKNVKENIKGNVTPETREIKLQKFDGTLFWGELSSSPLSDLNGNPVALMIICRDITDRKGAEYELIKSKDKAEESDRLKTAFLHNISHEIRTPMNAIIGFASLLSEPKLDDLSKNSFIEIINQSSNHLLSIVNDIIEISNIEAGIIRLNIRMVSLNFLMRNTYAQFNQKISEKGISFNFITGLPDDQSFIETDETKLIQIISCLLSNSIKFTEKGLIEFGYLLNKNILEFYVSDTGIGISEEYHNRIFDRFYQVENSISRQYEGTGLGLSIAKPYVELLGGKIWLESEQGSGTTFRFTIPHSAAEPAVLLDSENDEDQIKHSVGSKRVLIAEDEENNYRLIVELLSSLKLTFIHAVNGKEAVDICRSGKNVDLIIMDIKMPEMDGFEATAILKKMYPSLPIIAQTAFAFESDRDKILASGFDGYISKPIKKSVFLELIKKYL